MRETQKFGTLCMFIVLAAPAAAAAQGQGSCQRIRAACQNAGFAQGAAKLGIGLQVDCIIPIMSGTGQRPRARLPLPQVNPQFIADCATSHPRFGRQHAPPSEPISQPLREPGSSYPNDPAQVVGPGPGVPPPVLEGTLRPPMQIAPEQHDVVSALPPRRSRRLARSSYRRSSDGRRLPTNPSALSSSTPQEERQVILHYLDWAVE
jgi:hypothetical protein